MIVTGVVMTVEVTHDELLSEAVDRYLDRRPWVTRLAVGYLAAHLLNLVPARVDPLYRLSLLLGR